MGRVTVWVPDELLATVRTELAEVNMSAAMQAGLRALLSCDHDELTCASCGKALVRTEVTAAVLDAVYVELHQELAMLVHSHGTVEGAARVAKNVAVRHGVASAVTRPLPRVGAHRRRSEVLEAPPPPPTEIPLERGARKRHPTAHQPAKEATA